MQDMPPRKQVPDKIGWFDKPGNFKLFVTLFFVGLVVLLIADFFIHKHGHFNFEEAPEFFAAYGFIAYTFLIVVAKLVRKVIKRDENYYDD